MSKHLQIYIYTATNTGFFIAHQYISLKLSHTLFITVHSYQSVILRCNYKISV